MKISIPARQFSERIIRWMIFAIVLLIAVAGLVYSFHVTPTQISAEIDLVKVDDHPLYVLHYQGDYAFDEYLKEGLQADSASHLTGQYDWACTCFSALGGAGDLQFGRNFDWNDDHPALLLFTDPPDAFASVSLLDASYLGFGEGKPSTEAMSKLAEAPFLPADGMNEYGVAIAMMAVPHAEGGNDPARITIGSLDAIRLVLDYARDVEEALVLLKNYNIDFTDGLPLHYLIADPGGNSVVVEYLEHEMVVTRNVEAWQVATNFILSEKTLTQAKLSCDRYETAYDTLAKTGGKLSMTGSMRLLGDVSQEHTFWSVVYNMNSGDIQVVMGRNFGQPHNFKLVLTPKN